MRQHSIDAVYKKACAHPPYDYQRRLAENAWPDLLDIPTGLGKTAAVTLAWAIKRGWGQTPRSPDSATPRRLIWCLPMRVLVEQTADAIRGWLKELDALDEEAGDLNKVAVHVLMGGEDGARDWVSHPEQDQIIIGTQDMLLSRALMRGYGMSRYQWAMDYALLHNDALWVFDEVQLMGAGLTTSAQLDAFRRSMPLASNSRSLWVSATLNSDWLATVDFRQYTGSLNTLSLDNIDRDNPAISKRLNAPKALVAYENPPESSKKDDVSAYLKTLAAHMLDAHSAGGPTLAILNTVERAQELAGIIQKLQPDCPLIVVHSRFRAAERKKLNQQLLALDNSSNAVIVATQAIEAGVDLSAARLYTELAPWSSLVQRFGRCNRGGEFSQAQVFWIDITDEKLCRPYSEKPLTSARRILEELDSASSSKLPACFDERSPCPVIRRRDLINLFDTDPDLSGFDVDISVYVRDSDRPPLLVFWRDIENGKTVDDEPAPQRDELCPVSITQLQTHLSAKNAAWQWDGLANNWTLLKANQVRPGMTIMLSCAEGGYDELLGFVAKHKPKKNYQLISLVKHGSTPNAVGLDPDSNQHAAVELTVHLADTQREAQQLTTALDQHHYAEAMHTAALWHDVGKAHAVFQQTLHGRENGKPLLAKSPRGGKHSRPYFRHELASMLSWLANGEAGEHHDLIAYLIAAHHGKVRLSIRAWPDEKQPLDKNTRYARGVWDGDELVPINVASLNMPKTALSLDVMELGDSLSGASWTSRSQALLEQHGPFALAWLETLVRLADWRASSNPSKTLSNHDTGAQR